MTLEDLKKAKIVSMKEHNGNEVTALNTVISKLMLLATDRKAEGKTLSEDDVASVLKKTEKELTEEKESFEKAGRAETVKDLEEQLKTIEKYLPKMLADDEIKNIILSLDDKSMPSVMKYFKTNYGASVDMKKVSDILRSL